MKFSDMMDILAEISVEIRPLLEDEEFLNLLGAIKRLDGEEDAAYRIRMARNSLALFNLVMGKHEATVDRILARVLDCTVEELEEMTTGEIMSYFSSSLGKERVIGLLDK